MRHAALPVLLAVAVLTAGCAERERTPSPAERPAVPDEADLGDAWFREVAAASGLDFVHVSGHRERYFFPEIMGSGAALADLDGDGDTDAYVVQSGSLERPGADDARNRLYLNRGDGTFEDVSATSGADDPGYGMGVAIGDVDDDGDLDLYVTNVGPDVLLRNDGGGKFRDVTGEAGLGHPGWCTSAAFADFDGDGDLDLFVLDYMRWTVDTELDCVDLLGVPEYCPPANYAAPAPDALYRNDGGRFTDVSKTSGIAAEAGTGLGIAVADFDGDGLTDVFVANDGMFNRMWMNRGDLHFEDEGLLRGCAVDNDGVAKAGMGTMAVDRDGDGDRDLFVVNLERQSDSYYENDEGFFTDRSVQVGLGTVSRARTRFGMGLLDFDHDGRLDLYLANGRIARFPEATDPDPYAEPNLLLRGTDDGFEEVPNGGTAAPEVFTSRGAAFGDVDGDGGTDVLVVNRDGPVQLLRNRVADRGHWIAFRVRERSGRDALGATVSVSVGGNTVSRDVVSAYSYLSASEPVVRIGLGSADGVDGVTVRWPDGTTRTFGPLEGGRIHALDRAD